MNHSTPQPRNQRFAATAAIFLVTLLGALILPACKGGNTGIDASGTFEAIETIVSLEANGTIRKFDLIEGQTLQAGQSVGYVDSTQLYLKKRQLETQIQSILSQRPNVKTQVAALQVQLEAAEREQKRVTNLHNADAATQKQVDDAGSQVDMINKQLAAQRSALDITTESLNRQTQPLEVQIAQLNDQLMKCRIVNPVSGTVLTKYVEVNEMATPGKPLYKIADISSLNLRAYVTGDQYATLKLNQNVTVLTDNAGGASKEHQGTIIWISDKAEFTPKTIQTKEERANLVYAVKIRVPNDGTLKIGMYGDVRF